MSTNLEVIAVALRSINVIAETETPPAEQGAAGLVKLNDLMQSWLLGDIDLGYAPQTSTTDPCPIPPWAERAVKLGLAIELAPDYGKTVSAEFIKNFTDAYNAVLRKSTTTRLEPADVSHLPSGSGWGGVYDITTDLIG